MTCCAGPIVADVAMSHGEAAKIALLEELKANAKHMVDGSSVYILSAPAIHCGNCIATIESQVSKLPGVKSVRANLSLKRVSMTLEAGSSEHGSNTVSLLNAVEKLEQLGFPSHSLSREETGGTDPELTRLIRALAVAGFATANIMMLSIPVWNGADGSTKELFHLVSALIAIPCVAYAGMPFFGSAISALRHRRMNMDVPISLGVTLATGMSIYEIFIGGGYAYFDAAVSLLFFLLIGRTLDHMMRSKARAAASNLVRLAAKGGFVIGNNGELIYMALEALKPGMRIRVAAGERFPVDGKVVDGQSDVDRALVTGESNPVAVTAGAFVEAGTLNLTGSIDVLATRAARDSFLAEVTQMMTAAESGRSTYVRIADRMAKIYAPAVHVLALISFIGWMVWTAGDWHQSLTVAISVLIITCPCALGLAVPVAHVVSAGRLFSAGILMKDGSALERLAAITEALFDKTGTLTTGRPRVLSSSIPQGQLAAVAKALAMRSLHPASKALADYLDNTGQADVEITGLHEVPGCGVEAAYDGKLVRLGRLDWVQEIALSHKGDSAQNGVGFGVAGGALFVTQLSESLRPDARWAVEALQQDSISCRIVSGDNYAQVASIASRLGLANFRSGMRPADKLDALKQTETEGRKALMVGDGLNDAPALVAAYVSMAPASASDVGRSAADFVFTRNSLAAVVHARDIALATNTIVKQNFALAIIYNVFAVPLAMAGQLNPLLAAIAMSTSSIIVVGNSLRLYLITLRKPDEIEPQQQTTVPEGKFA